ncbi:hypothetical protein [Sphingomonas sp. BAUL-RG-20F-R05-02]|uniref:hypothetical protein n=1 Tax=Sphingomonas sp. BAUL-RG-20F-R05-02 TaxID=2914830 RepID=UPI001F584CC1|nr:hypothetical protein [Sphingomonas sp. BAUL-RG-20F-R05-02]
MNVITSIAPIVASAATLASSPTLILALGLLHLGAKAVGRLIPDSRKGVLGAIRKAAKVLAVEPRNRVFDTTSIVGTATMGAPAGDVIADVATNITAIAAQTEAVAPAAAVVADLNANAKAAVIAQIAAGKLSSLLGKLKS